MANTIDRERRRLVLGSAALAGGALLPAQVFANTGQQPAQAAGPIVLHGVSPRLTIHLLDTWHGTAATGLRVDFSRLEEGRATVLRSFGANAHGRSDEPLLIGESYQVGDYELLLHLDDYFRMKGGRLPSPAFLSKVPIRFRVASAEERLHLPVQFGPWNYTFYRGS